jgi:peptide deformylase
MALLNILQYPDERLHTVAKPVEKIDERIQKLMCDFHTDSVSAATISCHDSNIQC